MSEFDNKSFESSDDFLSNFEKEAHDFLLMIHGSLDHAGFPVGNTGEMTQPVNDENLSAVKWDAAAPQLPERLAALTTFTAGTPVTIHARHRYGKWASTVNIYIIPEDPVHSSFSLGLSIDPQSGEAKNSNSYASASEHGGQIPIDEEETKAVVDAIFEANPEYMAAANTLSLVDAFRLGIVAQPDYIGEQYTVEVAEKQFAAYSRIHENRVRGNQFSLKVKVLDRSHPNNKPSITTIKLRRHVEPIDYDPDDGVLDGVFVQGLEIVTQPDGKISSMSRTSSVNMYDEPAVTQVNGEETIVTMLNKMENGIPLKLAEKLYPTSEPTLQDLQFFQRLVTEPISEEDVYIS